MLRREKMYMSAEIIRIFLPDVQNDSNNWGYNVYFLDNIQQQIIDGIPSEFTIIRAIINARINILKD